MLTEKDVAHGIQQIAGVPFLQVIWNKVAETSAIIYVFSNSHIQLEGTGIRGVDLARVRIHRVNASK